jgi:transglutaminase-like putative cysteine protease
MSVTPGVDRSGGVLSPRTVARVAALVLTGSYLFVLYDVADVVGSSRELLAVVAVSFVVATLAARLVGPRLAALFGLLAFVAGNLYYLSSVPEGLAFVLSMGELAADTLALLTGLSVLQMVAVDAWVLAFAPAPVFLSWYLVLRGFYAPGAAVGGLALSVLVLTGDASLLATAVGVVALFATVGFGELSARGSSIGRGDAVVLACSLMIVATLGFSAVPGGAAEPILPESSSSSLEADTVDADEELSISGSVDLSPEVRFTVESDEPAYWRTDAYDRYTGDGWVQTGEPTAYDGALEGPEGESEPVEQAIRIETEASAMPAVWQPVEVGGVDDLSVTEEGGLSPAEPLSANDTYAVTSERPVVDPETLNESGTEYPDGVEERYTQLPDSTPDRVGEYTEELTAEAETPYETATIVEEHLREEWEYSLDVESPDGDITDQFLFEMDEAYCTYFATAMVTMLRSQDVPARFVVGYSEGERVDEDRWVVRGSDAHAWVEVYFPETGWVEFEPTPPSDREQVHDSFVEEAREDTDTEMQIDTDESGGEEWTPETDAETNETDETEIDPGEGDGEQVEDTLTPDAGNGQVDRYQEGEVDIGQLGDPVDLPDEDEDDDPTVTPELLGVGLAVVAGLAAGAHRSGAIGRTRHAVGIRWQRRSATPEGAVERAYTRLEAVLSREYRSRRAGESVRSYLETLSLVGLDDRATRVGALYERARYGDGVDEEEAEEAVSLVDAMVRERTPLLGRFR